MSVNSRLPGKHTHTQIAHALPSQTSRFGFVLSVVFWFFVLFCFLTKSTVLIKDDKNYRRKGRGGPRKWKKLGKNHVWV